jgi:hypothetical protein
MKTLTHYLWRALRWCGLWRGAFTEQMELPLDYSRRRKR